MNSFTNKRKVCIKNERLFQRIKNLLKFKIKGVIIASKKSPHTKKYLICSSEKNFFLYLYNDYRIWQRSLGILKELKRNRIFAPSIIMSKSVAGNSSFNFFILVKALNGVLLRDPNFLKVSKYFLDNASIESLSHNLYCLINRLHKIKKKSTKSLRISWLESLLSDIRKLDMDYWKYFDRITYPRYFSLIHNDLSPPNIIIDNSRIGLLDWDTAMYGDVFQEFVFIYYRMLLLKRQYSDSRIHSQLFKKNEYFRFLIYNSVWNKFLIDNRLTINKIINFPIYFLYYTSRNIKKEERDYLMNHFNKLFKL